MEVKSKPIYSLVARRASTHSMLRVRKIQRFSTCASSTLETPQLSLLRLTSLNNFQNRLRLRWFSWGMSSSFTSSSFASGHFRGQEIVDPYKRSASHGPETTHHRKNEGQSEYIQENRVVSYLNFPPYVRRYCAILVSPINHCNKSVPFDHVAIDFHSNSRFFRDWLYSGRCLLQRSLSFEAVFLIGWGVMSSQDAHGGLKRCPLSISALWLIKLAYIFNKAKSCALVLVDFLASSQVLISRILTGRRTIRCSRIWLGFCLSCRSLHRLWSRRGLRLICGLSVWFCVFGPLIRVCV